MQHSILGASSSKRWLNCPGSIALIKRAPAQGSSKYAAEGTAAHTLGERCLEDGKDPIDYKGAYIGDFLVNDDMVEAVKVYVDLIRLETKGLTVEIEKRFDLSWLYPGMFGTNDASAGEPFGTLRIYDYKHGAGIAVDALNNTQLMYYALGGAREKEYTHVEMIIVQPRAHHVDGPIRRWKITIDELNNFGKVLKKGAIATTKPNAKLKAGDHCFFCPAKAICKELKDHNHRMARAKFSDGEELPEVTDLTDEQINNVLAAEKLLKAYIQAIKDYAFTKIQKGKNIKGLKVVRGRRSRSWIDDGTTLKILGGQYNMNEIYDMKLKSVAQMEKSLGKKAVEDLVIVEEGKLTLALESDKRLAVDVNVLDKFTD